MKVLTVVGARPQLIKASVVSRALAEAGLAEILVHTGQHFDDNMSDVFFRELGMAPPAHHLGISGGGHGEMTGRMLIELERVFVREEPEVVLVYGDTNSTLAGALAAAKLHIPVAHVEAGLRSFNLRMPEEVNRVLTDRISSWLFAPTTEAIGHLQREGFSPAGVFQVGDVMYDVALEHGRRALALGRGVLEQAGLRENGFVLATVHRAENTDIEGRLSSIVHGLVEISCELPVVWPLHPRTRDALDKAGLLSAAEDSLRLLPPQGYLDMVRLEAWAAAIATDSGGVQKEAFFHQVPCVTLRDETEWTELVDAGWNTLCPPGSAREVAAAIRRAFGQRGNAIAPYGDGRTAPSIVSILQRGTPVASR